MTIPYDGGLTCALCVTDLERSIGWYRDVLGMELLYCHEDDGWCELQTAVGNVSLGLGLRESAGGPGGATLTFGVTDIEAAKATLDRFAVRQDGPIREIPGLVRLLTFFDPDDNALMLYEVRRDG